MLAPYPLQWPASRPRARVRRIASFGKKVREPGMSYDSTKSLTVGEAMDRLQAEVDRLGATDYVLTSNLIARLDGRPRSDQGNPLDPGVALYFTLKGKPHRMPCDTFTRAADNIAAIAKHIEAVRAIDRFGVADIAEMFSSFLAIGNGKRHWREVLGFSSDHRVDKADVELGYRRRAKEVHPDVLKDDGSKMAELNAAREEALKELAS